MWRGLKAEALRILFLFGGTRGLELLSDQYEIKVNKNFFVPKKRSAKSFLILRYHRVNDDKSPFSIGGVDPVSFAHQMRYLRNHYSVLCLEDLVTRPGEGDLPANAIAVTFDDGYRDNFACAFPILRRFEVPATIFLTTGYIGTGRMLWFDMILDAFERTRKNHLDIGDPAQEHIAWETVEARAEAAIRTLWLLRGLREGKREERVEMICKQLGVENGLSHTDAMLTWDQVRAMQKEGLRFGSHTVTHPVLSQCEDSQVLNELQVSKRSIENEIGCEVSTFAYPSGRLCDFNVKTIEMLEMTGYKCAVTIRRGCNDERVNRFLLRRNTPAGKRLEHFASGLCWAKLISKEN